MNRIKHGCIESFDGTKIRYISRGEGLPLYFADGIGCDGYVWKYAWKHFAEGCRLVHSHYRGHASSDKPKDSNNLTIQDLAEDILHVLDDDEVDKAILVGHSMGCQVIFEFAHLYPDRVLGLVPMCGSYGYPLKTFHDNKVMDTMFPVLYPLFVLTPWIPEAIWHRIVPTKLAYHIATNFEINGHMINYEDFMPYLHFIGKIDLRIFVKMLDHAARHTAETYLPEMQVPVLIIAGERDTFTPMWLSEKMFEMLPNAEMLVIPRGSHTGPIEMPQLVNLRLERWLLDHFAGQVNLQAKSA